MNMKQDSNGSWGATSAHLLLLVAIVAGGVLSAYYHTYPAVARASVVAVNNLSLDSAWCPLAHCDLHDTTFQSISPLLSVTVSQHISDTRIANAAAHNSLGCVTGQNMAVCAYDDPNYPGLAAFNYQDGSLLWLSASTDFPASSGKRSLNAPLIVHMAIGSSAPQTYVIASNPSQIIAYNADGTVLWRRSTQNLGVGTPVSFSIDSANEIVTATNQGWVIKLNPADGSLVDKSKLNTNAFVNNTLYSGTLITSNSPAIEGNMMYLVVQFSPTSGTIATSSTPVYVLRVQLTQPDVPGMETKIKPIITPMTASVPTPDRANIGVNTAQGSPALMTDTDGSALIFTDAYRNVGGMLVDSISGVRDSNAVLQVAWNAQLGPNDRVLSAAALDSASATLLVNATYHIYLFTHVNTLQGTVALPTAISPIQMITCGRNFKAALMLMGSPTALAFNAATNELVAYTNFRFILSSSINYPYLGAFAIPLEAPSSVHPLWCRPLSGANGGNGTRGQPVLFKYTPGSQNATGLIVNPDSTGTYIFR